MDTEQGSVIRLKVAFQQTFNTKGMEEFLDQKKSSVGGKFPSIKVYNKLFVAF